MNLRKRTFLFPHTLRRRHPLLNGFYAKQRDPKPKRPMPPRKKAA